MHSKVSEALGLSVDPATLDVGRLYYLPSRPPDAPPEFPAPMHNDGHLLDPTPWESQARADAPKLSRETAPRLVAVPRVPENFVLPEGLDLQGAIEAARKVRSEKTRKVVLDCLNGSFRIETGGRDNGLHLAACSLASVLPKPPTPATIETLLQPTFDTMDCYPEGLDYWRRKLAFSYERAVERRLENDAKDRAAREAIARIAGRALNGQPLPRESSTSETRSEVGPEGWQDDGDNWRQRLITKKNSDGEVKSVENVAVNVATILRNEEAFRGHLRFNDLNREIEVLGGPLKGVPSSDLDTALSNWLAQSEYSMRVSRADCGAQLIMVARQNSYNPVTRWLRSLKWDGKERLSTFLGSYCAAEGKKSHVEVVSRKFMIAAVARALKPGCKVDEMLVLYGDQGVGKSRMVRALGGNWTATAKLEVTNKDSVMVATSSWFVEMAELAGMRRSDRESLKAFLSTEEDAMRVPYGRVVEKFKRRSVFVGTTNDPQCLSDETGNRRFWPIAVSDVDVERIERDREQLFAEAVVAFEAGETWWLRDEEARIAAEEAEVFTAEDPLKAAQDAVKQWYLGLKHPRPARFSALDVAREVFSYTMSSSVDNKHGVLIRVGRALTELEFRRVRGASHGLQRQWMYEVPEWLRTAGTAVTVTGNASVGVDPTAAKEGSK
jgi:predicted P-loop ATPase